MALLKQQLATTRKPGASTSKPPPAPSERKFKESQQSSEQKLRRSKRSEDRGFRKQASSLQDYVIGSQLKDFDDTMPELKKKSKPDKHRSKRESSSGQEQQHRLEPHYSSHSTNYNEDTIRRRGMSPLEQRLREFGVKEAAVDNFKQKGKYKSRDITPRSYKSRNHSS